MFVLYMRKHTRLQRAYNDAYQSVVEALPLIEKFYKMGFNIEATNGTANFLKAHLYSTRASLAAGMVILEKENVEIDRLMGHGGLFKTPVVGQKYLAAATNSPVWVMETAGEGGPYGIALLAAYLKNNETVLEDFLFNTVFADAPGSKLEPQSEDVAGFKTYLDRFLAGLKVEQAAIETL